ncbi:acyltransferase family protein [Jannaschia pohangensis]|uniref:Peptidoglycan/LPS O-acetylase OafA/YrhL, contains acyltransferase and SGNH-hydrolase domains n=1 Tax=Jannaschia pohangensis TaxID=390807 RepID=A0A1I3IP15_9RHOB|nr:acyltransferase [Jannaschia pohangensis]SFI49513.1 Peptidoglycan/LPS O-acetylase OafA/YrhL, contains acyltransferase and SGNH-hydrolase domains [Jannaschia pohangensis]
MRLAEASEGRDNNLNLLRFVAAFAVLVSHAWPLASGRGTMEPLEGLIGHSLGAVAVTVFFVASGFLITGSWVRRPQVADFVAARVLRLFPALLVVLLATVVILGPWLTDLSPRAYVADPLTWTYLPRNLSLALLQYDLPGVFRTAPYPEAINGSLWTLFHEAACYALVLALGVAGWITGRMGAVFAAYAVFYLGGAAVGFDGRLGLFHGLSLPFVLGMAGWVWRDRIVLIWPVGLALLALALVSRDMPWAAEMLVLALAYWTALLAYRPGGMLRRWNRMGDYSYGIYIWAFPVQQVVVHAFGPMTPLANIALSAGPVLILAVLSWHLVERPALAARPRLVARLRATEASPIR